MTPSRSFRYTPSRVQVKTRFEIPPDRRDAARAAAEIPGVWVDFAAEPPRIDIPANAFGLVKWAGDVSSPQFSAYAGYGFDDGVLRAYQTRAMQFLYDAQRVVLADAMGLGKTRTAALAAWAFRQTLGRGPILIIGPQHLRESWRQELVRIGLLSDGADSRWCALRTVDKSSELAESLWNKDARFYFCHYEILHAWWDRLYPLRPAASILDEAHLVKNWRTRRAQAVALACGATPMRIVLTGTPLLNRPQELYSLLSLATGKFTWGTPSEFLVRYCGGKKDKYGGVEHAAGLDTHQAELRARLDTCFVRRTIEDVGLDLPPLTREPILVEPEREELKQYASLFDGYDPRAILDALLDRRGSTQTFAMLDRARKLASGMKLRATLRECESALAAGEQVVVFTWLKAAAKYIAAESNALCITGEMSQDARDGTLAGFIERAEARAPTLLAATYGSLSVGVNLQCARIVLLHDLDWTPATLLQAEARAYRSGQTRPVLSKWMLAKGTLDEYLASILLAKADVIAKTLGDREPARLADVLGAVKPESAFERFFDDLERWRSAA